MHQVAQAEGLILAVVMAIVRLLGRGGGHSVRGGDMNVQILAR